MSHLNIVETTNGIILNDKCPLCQSSIAKNSARSISKGPIDRYCENEDYHYHDSGVYEGKWYCANGHSGLYYQHRLCNVTDCDYSQI